MLLKTTNSLATAVLLLILSLGAFAQSPTFKAHKLGKTKQLPKVNCMVHDENNFIYFGTNEGLIFYNGISYSAVALPDSLSKEKISALYLLNNELYIGTESGKIIIKSGEYFRLIAHENYQPSAKISAICKSENTVIVSTYGDGVYFFENGKARSHANFDSGLNDDYTYDLLLTDHSVWVATDAGLAELDFQGNNLSQFRMSDGLPDNIVHSLALIDQNTMAIGMYDYGIGFYNLESKTYHDALTDFDWNKGPVEDIIVESPVHFWVATKSEGLVEYQVENGNPYLRSYSEINGLISNKINSLMRDAEGNIWIGTQNGASVYTGSTFQYIGESEGLINQNIFAILKTKDQHIWLSSLTGLRRLSYTRSGEPQLDLIIDYSESEIQQVVSMLEDAEGNIWLGTYGSGLLKWNKASSGFEKFDTKDGLENLNILDIVQDNMGNLWLATLGGGLIEVEFVSGKAHFKSVSKSWDELSKYIYSIYIDQNQMLWLATDGTGVKAFNCVEHHLKPIEIEAIAAKTVYSITGDLKDNIWFTVADEGLYRLSQGQVKKYGPIDGLKSNDINNVICLESGAIAAIHSAGIDIIQPGSESFQTFSIDKKDFVFEPNLNALFVSNNSLYIGSENGVVEFNATAGNIGKIAPKVGLFGMQVMNEYTNLSSDLTFGYDQNHVIFEYLGSWMKKPESLVYKYKLEGFDKDWSYETQSLIANYSSLPPGTYTFMVTAKSDEGIWSDPQLSSVTFTIKNPFWKEWWFYLLVVAAGVSFIAIYIRVRTKKLLEDKQRLESEVHKRTEEIRHQKNIIEHKNEEILSSIAYAKRIQEAILPPSKLVKEHLKESFILYKPKDIVAGDFYWFDHMDDLVIFAAADCTGHGVPGAMVSVVCSNALNRAVREFGNVEPAKILDKTLELVLEQFEKSEEDVKDGMDIALCSLNLKTHELNYAGANNPLWIIKNNAESELVEIKATKQPIGKYAQAKKYENHTLQLTEGDMVYLFSDGFADQFGGEKGKKFKYSSLKELFLLIHKNPLERQKDQLNERFETWRGDLEQIDDVCVIGVRI